MCFFKPCLKHDDSKAGLINKCRVPEVRPRAIYPMH